MQTLSERLAMRLADAGLTLEQISGVMEGIREELAGQAHVTNIVIGPLNDSEDELVKATDAQLRAAGCQYFEVSDVSMIIGELQPRSDDYVLLDTIESGVWLFTGSEAELRSRLDNLSPREV